MFHGFFRRLVLVAVTALAGVLLLGSSVFAASVSPAPSRTPAGATAPHDRSDWIWGKRIQGQPTSFGAGGTDGYYVWHGDASDGFHGLHLRTTDSKGVFKYDGTLRSNGVFADVSLVKPESDDHYELTDGGHVLTFQLVTAEGIDGLDFHVNGGTTVRFALNRDGHLVDPSNIFLGEDSVHPHHNPFHIHRHRVRDKGNAAKTRPKAQATATPTPAAG